VEKASMPPRSSWKGYLKLSLVSCPVALYPASTTTERIRFNTLNRKTGNRVKRQFIDAETGEVVENEDQVRGYEIARGQYIMIEDDELSAIAFESTHTIDIESFAPRSSIDERYLDTSYYIAPDDRVAQEAFAVIRETMRKKKMVGIARVVLQRRERILKIEPLGKGLLATSLRYGNEVRQADSYFEDVPDVMLSDEMIDLASHIIERKALVVLGTARAPHRHGRAHARRQLVSLPRHGDERPHLVGPDHPAFVEARFKLGEFLVAEDNDFAHALSLCELR